MVISSPWLFAWMALALVLMLVQLSITPAYGRHSSAKWGPSISNKIGWVLMEAVALFAFWAAWLSANETAGASLNQVAILAAVLWTLHYIHRAFVYPLRTRTRGKRMPVVIMLAAVVFNLINGGMIGASLGAGHVQGGAALLSNPATLLGVALFVLGAVINLWADNTLLALRRGSDSGYHIPHGGLFEWVSCPNFLGEIIQWAGFAVLCWNLPALAFAVWTASNLVPRARAPHIWYVQQFAHYPAQRRVLVPKLW